MQIESGRRPSANRLQYLVELEKLEHKSGIMSKIAKNCGVNVSAVSRWIKMCIKNEFLTEDYDFTPLGRQWFEYYRTLYTDLKKFLRAVRVPEELVEENADFMFNHVDVEVLQNILVNTDIRQKQTPIKRPPE